MAIDRTGISSLDSGALDIKYTGDEGPKSPQQIAGGEYNRVIELLDKVKENIPLSEEEKIELQQLIRTLTAKGIDVEALMGESGDMRMASADPMLQDEYDKYVFELQEMHPEAVPMSIEEFKQQAISGMASGGIARLGLWNGGPHQDRDTGSDYGQFDRAVSRAANNPPNNPPSNNTVDIGFQEALRKQNIAEDIKEKQQDKDYGQFFEKKPVVEKPTMGMWVDDVRNKVYQSGLNREKVLAMRKMSLLSPMAQNVWMAIIQGAGGKVPEWAEDLTEEKLIEMASDVQGIKDYGQATYNPNLNPAKEGSGVELLGRVFEGQDILDRNNMSQEDWDRLFPSNITPPRDGPPIYPYPLDVHPGTGEDETETETEPSDWATGPVELADRTTDDYDYSKDWERIYGQSTIPVAHGGRIPAAYGGIMDLDTGRRAYGLGSIWKKAKKTVKKFAKSDIGKAALMYAAFHFGPQFLAQSGSGVGRGMKGWKGLQWLDKGWDPVSKTFLNPRNVNMLKAIGIPSIAGLFAGEDKDDDSDLLNWHEREKQKYLAQMGGPWPTGPVQLTAQGGRIGYAKGGNDEEGHRSAALSALYGIRKNAQEGGLMNLGGMEKDYRQEGGFVPLGGEERADDVPARLSKNEFVFTADAVRAAGGGDIDAGAEVMENVMNNLEQGGQVSEESQGLEGARDMFATAQRLEGVL